MTRNKWEYLEWTWRLSFFPLHLHSLTTYRLQNELDVADDVSSFCDDKGAYRLQPSFVTENMRARLISLATSKYGRADEIRDAVHVGRAEQRAFRSRL